MGLCGSALDKRYREAVDGKVDRLFQRLGVSEGEGKKWFKEFEGVAGNDIYSTEMNLDEFFEKFELDWSAFGQRIFMIMDASGDHRLDFAEFFTGMWNYCTLNREDLEKFAFDLFDSDGSGTVDKIEIRKLVYMACGKNVLDKDAQKVMDTLDADGDGEVTFNEFKTMIKKTPSLLFPVFNLQKSIREKFMGVSYWKKATKRREKNIKGKDAGKDLIALRWELYNRGKTFNRKEVWKAAEIVQEGVIKHDKGNRKVTVWKTPQSTDKKLRKKVCTLALYTTINLVEKVTGDDEIKYWKIGEDRYVNADYVSRDATWGRMEREQKALEKQRVDEEKADADAAAALEAKKKEVFETWVEKKDNDGKVFYFNVKTQETRRFNPFEGPHKLCMILDKTTYYFLYVSTGSLSPDSLRSSGHQKSPLTHKDKELAFEKDITVNETLTYDYNTTEERLAEPFKDDLTGRWVKGYGSSMEDPTQKSFSTGQS
eukprot:g467.t1